MFVNKEDIQYIGSERALEVQCIQVDLKRRTIDPLWSLEQHLKFNPWQEIVNPEERAKIVVDLRSLFSESEVREGIEDPLSQKQLS